MHNETMFVNGFVAVLGPGAAEAELRLPRELELGERTMARGARHRVTAFGRTAATLNGSTGSTSVWVKGRPHPEGEGGGLEGLASRDSAVVERSFRGLDGKFSLLALSPDGAAACGTDVLGHGPLFYCERGGLLYVSSHLGVLLCTLGEWSLDPVGLVSLAVAGAPICGRTSALGVRRLRPCEYLHVEASAGGDAVAESPVAWHLRSYADLASLLGGGGIDPEMPEEHYYTLLDDALRQAIAREKLSGAEGLMLSGGRDSRAVALVLARDFGLRPASATYGIASSMDVERGSQLARRLGLPHEVIPYESWSVEDYARRIVGLNGGMSGLQTACLLPGYEFGGRRFGTVISGYLGDAAIGTRIPADPAIDVETLVRTVFFYLNAPDVLAQAYFPEEVATLIGEVARTYQEWDAFAPHQRWTLGKLTLYYGPVVAQGFDLCESLAEICYPLFSRAQLRLALQLPEHLARGRRLYDGWLRRTEAQLLGDPHHARVPAGGGDAIAPRDASVAEVMRPDSIHWARTLAPAREWLRDRVEASVDEPRMRSLCRKSLDQSASWTGATAMMLWPSAVSVLGASLTREYCR